MIRLINTRTGETVIDRLLVRATFWGRFRGLLLTRNMENGSAMFFIETRRVHSFGMLFPLDLYFFNKSMCLIGSTFKVMPWAMPVSPKETRHILEIQSSTQKTALTLNIGEQVSILWDM